MKKDVPSWARMRWWDWLLVAGFILMCLLAWTDLANWLGIEKTWDK